MKISLFALACLPSLVFAATNDPPEPVIDSVIVRYHSPAPLAVAKRSSLSSTLKVVKASSTQSVQALIQYYQKQPNVAYVEPNYLLKQEDVPNDPDFHRLWAFQNDGSAGGIVGADIDAPGAWAIHQGSRNVIIGIIDSGIDYRHEDLAPNIWVNPNEIPNNQIDDDENGYVDDIYGISALKNTADPMDTNRHGTHVAGIIGATGNNEKGIVGVNWQTQMVGCSFIGSSGFGSVADAVKCLDYMIALKANGQPIRVINASWGGGGDSQTLKEAIQRAAEADIIFVASAGNDGRNTDQTIHFPSGYDLENIVSVASTDRLDQLSSFSNYGQVTVDVAAPGSGIYSTVPGDSYASLSGTSMAAPMVTGTFALMLARKPDLTAEALISRFYDSTEKLTHLFDKVPEGRRLNLARALEYADPIPSFVIDFSDDIHAIAQGSNSAMTLSLRSLFDWSGEAKLTILHIPDGVTATLDDARLREGEQTKIKFTVNDSVPVDNYTLMVVGESGDLTVERTLILEVLPKGTRPFHFVHTPEKPIPDNDPHGLVAELPITLNAEIWDAEVEVDIAHLWRGELIVQLITPDGEAITLHEKTGGIKSNIQKRYLLPELRGMNTAGIWGLKVIDTSPFGEGMLKRWQFLPRAVPAGSLTPIQKFSLGNAVAQPLPDKSTIRSEIPVPERGVIRSLHVSVDISHSWRNDLVVTLTSPQGTRVVLQENSGGLAKDLQIDMRHLSQMNGEPVEGIWVLEVSDTDVMNDGQLNHWYLDFVTAFE
ncbi:S8 family serine peptidase [Algicola sagamiensis]|uniref:S8 family serine peptidase n=1 Tax=Algicola sagamiensis TaxID=163869 RepID=UPI00035D056B|nr:S8 family serine peptidase [Algicola sagamiensis]